MRGLPILRSQTRHHLVASLRDGQMLGFNVVLPLVIFGFFTTIFDSEVATPVPRAGYIAFNPYYAAGLMAYAVAQGTFATLVISLTALRESGTLKRLRGTPLPMWAFVLARFLVALLFVAVGVLALGLLAFAAFDVYFGARIAMIMGGYLVLGTFTFTCWGFALTSFTTSVPSATAIATTVVMVLSFISGVFLTIELLPSWLQTVGQYFPLEPLANGLQATFATSADQVQVARHDVTVLLIWAAAGLALARWRFRWEPRTRR